jgi:hypothetical protein
MLAGREKVCRWGTNRRTVRLCNCPRQQIESLATSQNPPAKLDQRILDATAAISRQRQLIALQVARRENAASAKSLLSAMVYSLKVLKRRLRSKKG